MFVHIYRISSNILIILSFCKLIKIYYTSIYLNRREVNLTITVLSYWNSILSSKMIVVIKYIQYLGTSWINVNKCKLVFSFIECFAKWNSAGTMRCSIQIVTDANKQLCRKWREVPSRNSIRSSASQAHRTSPAAR